MAFAIAFAKPVHADTTYTYTGNPLTLDLGLSSNIHYLPYCPEGSPCGYMSIDFVVSQPLSQNLFDAHINPTFFEGTFIDTSNFLGSFEFDPQDAPDLQGAFVITTDSSGNLTNWGVNLTDQSAGLLMFTNNGEDFLKLTGPGGTAEADNAGMPGTWALTTTGDGGSSGGTSVPEPSSVLLLASGLASLKFARGRLRRWGSRRLRPMFFSGGTHANCGRIGLRRKLTPKGFRTSSRTFLLSFLLAWVCTGASQANADQITITESASSAAGFAPVGGEFFDKTVTVTFVGDTSNVLSMSSCPSPASDTFCIVSPLFAGTTTIKIAGIGTFTFVDPTYTFVNQTDGIAGIVDNNGTLQAVLDTVNSSFETYTLMTSIGPLSGEALFAFGGVFAETTEGPLHLEFTSSTTSTYTATIAGTTAVTEPSSLLLLGAVLPGLAMVRRQRKPKVIQPAW
jgi:hypothetical protein